MKAVMISINKPHTDNIFDGKKTNEWRTKPLPLGKHYVYETKNKGGCGKVIGEMEIYDNVKVHLMDIGENYTVDTLVARGCVSEDFLQHYAYSHDVFVLYANLIKNAKRYDTPKELSEFFTKGECKVEICEKCSNFHLGKGWLDGSYYDEDCCIDSSKKPITRPPQSWQFVEEL